MTDKIAIVGAGLIGRAWAIVFARAGRQVALYDPDPLVVPAALETIGVNLADLVESGLIADPAETIQRIEPVKKPGSGAAWRPLRPGERAGEPRDQAGSFSRARSPRRSRRGAGELVLGAARLAHPGYTNIVHYLRGPADTASSLSCCCQARTPSVTRSWKLADPDGANRI